MLLSEDLCFRRNLKMGRADVLQTGRVQYDNSRNGNVQRVVLETKGRTCNRANCSSVSSSRLEKSGVHTEKSSRS